MTRTPAELRELVRCYQEGIGPETGERSAGFLLREHGAEAVPLVLEAFEVVRGGMGMKQAHLHFEAVVRLANLLAELGDARATAALIYLALVGDEFVFENPLRLFIPKLVRQADATSLAALVEILRRFRYSRPRMALLVAEQLVKMAEQNPVQELAAALPLLRCGLLDPAAPLEFSPLRKRLKAALHLTNLPLAASAPTSAENLPLPSEIGGHSDD
jgi:hypothetical protein